MAKTIPQFSSMNVITAEPVSQQVLEATFESASDSLASINAFPGLFAKGCTLKDLTTGAIYENFGTADVPQFLIVSGSSVQVTGATIATTGDTDAYLTMPKAGKITAALFSSLAALAASDTNYITFVITNLGQAGAGTTLVLAATDANTTKATGGSALVANSKRTLTLNGTAANLVVAAGDRIRVRASVTGTLAGAVTVPTWTLNLA